MSREREREWGGETGRERDGEITLEEKTWNNDKLTSNEGEYMDGVSHSLKSSLLPSDMQTNIADWISKG